MSNVIAPGIGNSTEAIELTARVFLRHAGHDTVRIPVRQPISVTQLANGRRAGTSLALCSRLPPHQDSFFVSAVPMLLRIVRSDIAKQMHRFRQAFPRTSVVFESEGTMQHSCVVM